VIRPAWSVAIGLLLIAASPNILFSQIRLASGYGEANIGAQRVIVHATVAVPPGLDGLAVAEDAIRAQGARPFHSAEFATTGLVWDQFVTTGDGDDFLEQHYNPTGEPVAAEGLLRNSELTWDNVGTSVFDFQPMGTTSRCPSLVKECQGPQTFDEYNDVGWLSIGGCCTLAVTWFSTTIDEADMALNTRFSWTNGGGSGYDIETVMLHENGHVLGLDHTLVPGSIMEATYGGLQHALGEDDERGVTYLYPDRDPSLVPPSVGSISGIVTDGDGTAIYGASVSIVDVPILATTDSNGAYALDDVPNIGSYSVTASAPGYVSQTITGETVPSSGTDFQLQAEEGGGDSGGGDTGECVPKGRFGFNCL
jgi:hypothetical protein